MSQAKATVTAQEAFAKAANSGNLAALDDLVAPDCIDHDHAPGQGHEATGRSVKVRGVQISRFADGKLVERWGSSDQLGMLSQLRIVSI